MGAMDDYYLPLSRVVDEWADQSGVSRPEIVGALAWIHRAGGLSPRAFRDQRQFFQGHDRLTLIAALLRVDHAIYHADAEHAYGELCVCWDELRDVCSALGI